MENYTNPLDKIRIASPCSADWNEMQGDARKRFCGDCKLHVYNLSAMTRKEAETLLINSGERLCVTFYRRADGTILSENCPVGWARVKQRVSAIATAAFSMFFGFFGGNLVQLISDNVRLPDINMNIFRPASEFMKEKPEEGPSFGGVVTNLSEIRKSLK